MTMVEDNHGNNNHYEIWGQSVQVYKVYCKRIIFDVYAIWRKIVFFSQKTQPNAIRLQYAFNGALVSTDQDTTPTFKKKNHLNDVNIIIDTEKGLKMKKVKQCI